MLGAPQGSGTPSRPTAGVAGFFIFSLLLNGTLDAQDSGRCVSCHPRQADQEAASFHSAAARCTDCHGGDSAAETRERAHADPFTNASDRSTIPSLCSRCHSDARRMNPFGLPTDPLAQYRTSKHGEALERGITDVAICTDCHGSHGLQRLRDPAGPVHPANLPRTCGRCHGDADLMKRHGLSSDTVGHYFGSVHGLLLGKGDFSAPHCATCHGNHGAVPPGFSEIGQVCGRCHARQKEHFETSPHAFYARDGSFPGCVACHGNHFIARSATEMLPACARCHEPKDAEMRKFDRIRKTLDSARAKYRATEERLSRLARAGFPLDEERARLEQARTERMQLPLVQHRLDTVELDRAGGVLGSILEEIESRLDGKEKAERTKRFVLIPVWIFLVGLALLFRWKSRRLDRARRQSEGPP